MYAYTVRRLDHHPRYPLYILNLIHFQGFSSVKLETQQAWSGLCNFKVYKVPVIVGVILVTIQTLGDLKVLYRYISSLSSPLENIFFFF